MICFDNNNNDNNKLIIYNIFGESYEKKIHDNIKKGDYLFNWFYCNFYFDFKIKTKYLNFPQTTLGNDLQ